MKERIKQVRKKQNLSQTEFGKVLGVSRDVISNYEMGRVEPTDLFIKYLCATFNVNEEWLRNGQGEMFVKSKQTILDDLVRAYGLSDKKANIIKAFLDLSPEGQAGVLEYVDNIIQLSRDTPPKAEPTREEQIAQRLGDIDKLIKEDQKINK